MQLSEEEEKSANPNFTKANYAHAGVVKTHTIWKLHTTLPGALPGGVCVCVCVCVCVLAPGVPAL